MSFRPPVQHMMIVATAVTGVAMVIAANTWRLAARESGALAGPWAFMVAVFFSGLALATVGLLGLSHLLRRREALRDLAVGTCLAFGVASPAIAVAWTALQTWG